MGIEATGSRPRIRDGAERSLLLVIVSFAIAVVGTRWFLHASGYPQVGGGELHIAHMLWGGLALVVGALLMLVVSASWVASVGAILTGAGTGLFIDEVGKFITASNDYFYPLAAPLIYGVFLALALVFILVRNRAAAAGQAAAEPSRGWLSRTAYRRALVGVLLLMGLGWLVSVGAYLSLDDAEIRRIIDTVTHVPGDRIERPSEPLFYFLEALVLGASSVLLVASAVVLGTGREGSGTAIAILGLVVALTAGALLSLYVEQISALTQTIVHVLLLLAVLRFRSRFLGAS